MFVTDLGLVFVSWRDLLFSGGGWLLELGDRCLLLRRQFRWWFAAPETVHSDGWVIGFLFVAPATVYGDGCFGGYSLLRRRFWWCCFAPAAV
jgi:hypothetical protein